MASAIPECVARVVGTKWCKYCGGRLMRPYLSSGGEIHFDCDTGVARASESWWEIHCEHSRALFDGWHSVLNIRVSGSGEVIGQYMDHNKIDDCGL